MNTRQSLVETRLQSQSKTKQWKEVVNDGDQVQAMSLDLQQVHNPPCARFALRLSALERVFGIAPPLRAPCERPGRKQNLQSPSGQGTVPL
jgi:hypothetical protein